MWKYPELINPEIGMYLILFYSPLSWILKTQYLVQMSSAIWREPLTNIPHLDSSIILLLMY